MVSTEGIGRVRASTVAVVVDIEALDTTPTAKIGTIGAVAVDVLTGKQLGWFYQRIDLAQKQRGRTVDPSTEAFWEQQSTENPGSWCEMFDPGLARVSLPVALIELSEFIKGLERSEGAAVQVVGNGPEYDNAALADAYHRCEIPLPWSYWGNQSLRTAVWMGRLLLGVDPKRRLARASELHHALHDAQHEAAYLVAIMDAFQAMTARAKVPGRPRLRLFGYSVELASLGAGMITTALTLLVGAGAASLSNLPALS